MGDAIDGISAEALRGHLRMLTARGPRHEGNRAAVRATLGYLVDCLSDFGYTVQPERYGEALHQTNLLAELPAVAAASSAVDGRVAAAAAAAAAVGGDPTGSAADPVVEVCAHWDSVAGSPGADDNASGVAGLLEIARVFATDEVPRGRLRFCLFGEEEDEQLGYLGARAHVARLDAGGPPVAGAVVLEMIGYRDTAPGSQRFPADLLPGDSPLRAHDRGDFVAAVGNLGAEAWLAAVHVAGEAEEPPLPVLPLPVPVDVGGNATRSDHLPYWRSGRHGVMITDTAEFRNPHYHWPSDLMQTLDYAFAAAVTRTVARALRNLCT